MMRDVLRMRLIDAGTNANRKVAVTHDRARRTLVNLSLRRPSYPFSLTPRFENT